MKTLIFQVLFADYSFQVKTIETHARTFLPLNISAIGTVVEMRIQMEDEVSCQGNVKTTNNEPRVFHTINKITANSQVKKFLCGK